jgi:putative membrane protein insertion efficiency factor
VVRLPARAVVGLLRLWQLLVSPVYGQTCRFYPSCTAYAAEAVDTHGLVRGGWLTVRRLGRCHPWNPGGVDLVPARGERRGAPVVDGPAGDTPKTPATSVADHRPPRRAA